MRRCGLCRGQGHNRNHCPNRASIEAEQLRIKKEKEDKITKKNALEKEKIARKVAIKNSSLSFVPYLVEKKIEINDFVFKNITTYSNTKYYLGPQYNKFIDYLSTISSFQKKMVNIWDYIKHSQLTLFSSKFPLYHFHELFPLSFWVYMLRDLKFLQKETDHIVFSANKIKQELDDYTNEYFINEVAINDNDIRNRRRIERISRENIRSINKAKSSICKYIQNHIDTSKKLVKYQADESGIYQLLPFDLIPIIYSYL